MFGFMMSWDLSGSCTIAMLEEWIFVLFDQFQRRK